MAGINRWIHAEVVETGIVLLNANFGRSVATCVKAEDFEPGCRWAGSNIGMDGVFILGELVVRG